MSYRILLYRFDTKVIYKNFSVPSVVSTLIVSFILIFYTTYFIVGKSNYDSEFKVLSNKLNTLSEQQGYNYELLSKITNSIPDTSDDFLLTATDAELRQYVNRLHTTHQVVVYTADMNVDRTRHLFMTLLESVGEQYTKEYAELLLFTRQVESNGGRLTKQKNGPALSVFQIEPATFNDLKGRVLPKYPKVKTLVDNITWKSSVQGINQLEFDETYAMFFAYLKYKDKLGDRCPPSSNDKVGLAETHKKYYNTYLGDSTVSESLYKTMGL